MTDFALPVLPLLRTFLREQPRPVTARSIAIQSATRDWLNAEWLSHADEATLRGQLLPFYECVVDPPLHCETISRRVRFIRFGLTQLMNGSEPIVLRLDRCVLPNGPYFQAGFGMQFWSAILQATNPNLFPGWTIHTRSALARLNIKRRSPRETPGQEYAKLLVLADTLRREEPTITGLQIDDFLESVAHLSGRELNQSNRPTTTILEDLARIVRTKYPLRERLKAHRQVEEPIRLRLSQAIQTQDAVAMRQVLSEADVSNSSIHDDALLECVTSLWNAEQPLEELAEIWRSGSLLGVGLSFPVAILHLRNAVEYPPWDEVSRAGLSYLDDGYNLLGPPTEGYQLYREAGDELRRRFRLHPLEVADLFRMAGQPREQGRRAGPNFYGFCRDTFDFLRELNEHNHREWMAEHRERYQFAVREPMIELCHALVERYIKPLLNQPEGWDLETEARVGKALSSITRNDHGQSQPYETAQWITFYRRSQQTKRDDVQLFVKLDETGVFCGLKLGRRAREAGKRFRGNIQLHAELLFERLHSTNTFSACQFLDDANKPIRIESPADLRRWATGKNLIAQHWFSKDDPLTRKDDLVGEILLTFHKLLPAYRCGVDDSPEDWLARPKPLYTRSHFLADTLLEETWLDTASSLLAMKQQLILQGVPGTGKTHVARQLAKLLTSGDSSRVRLVQFHPGYTYEEFIEGPKGNSTDPSGGPELQIEDGVLCEFARQAASNPNQKFVLLIDEINRGNLPRIFGELLYLLEYREHELVLPYSRRPFRLPPNLYFIATMNETDRSVVTVDQALRRRFSFVEMPPSREILEHWLTEHPAQDTTVAMATVNLFEQVNRQLREDVNATTQVGHSYFMIRDLDWSQLRIVWEHHVRPLLAEYLGHHLQRLNRYDLDRLLKAGRSSS